ncbi:unnamed protein product [Adineta steineri]|uniref:Uncharacterized protein n=1 Tax=Adineta steineri TaxID=433720 RepID=A0A820B3E9_9BILA|nr:unnamed protein product [Adineta steineri]
MSSVTDDKTNTNTHSLTTQDTFDSTSTEKQSFWNDNNANRTSIHDLPQLEYDEHHITLIADRGKSRIYII